jgi:hypothetical protein
VQEIAEGGVDAETPEKKNKNPFAVFHSQPSQPPLRRSYALQCDAAAVAKRETGEGPGAWGREREKAAVTGAGGGREYEMNVYKFGDIVSDSIARDGAWEREDTEWVLGRLAATADTYLKTRQRSSPGEPAEQEARSRAVLLDIGANIGWFTLAAAVRGYSVVAFEPFARNFALLASSVCDVAEARRVRGKKGGAALLSSRVSAFTLGEEGVKSPIILPLAREISSPVF